MAENKRLYNIWIGMKNRCYGNHKSHASYRNNNIKVCDLWMRSYQHFEIWALANGYNNDLQIDRINPLGNYEPKNCRWVSAQENCRNKVNQPHITIDGEQMPLWYAIETLGLPKHVVYKHSGQSVTLEELKEVRTYAKRKVTIRGETLNAKQVAQKYNIPYPTLIYRLNYGYDGEDLICSDLRK